MTSSMYEQSICQLGGIANPVLARAERWLILMDFLPFSSFSLIISIFLCGFEYFPYCEFIDQTKSFKISFLATLHCIFKRF